MFHCTKRQLFLIFLQRKIKNQSPDVLDKIAKALNIKTWLFTVPPNPEDVMERLRMSIIKDIDNVVANAARKAFKENCKS